MTKKLRGQFRLKLDQKGRLSLPSSLRSSLSLNKKKELQLVATNGIYNNHRYLDVYPLKQWEALEKKISSWPQLKPEVQAYKRFYMAAGQILTGDSQNRFLLPLGLRQFAGIEEGSEIVMVGMSEKIEIWPALIWNKLNQQMSEDFEQVLASIAQLESAD